MGTNILETIKADSNIANESIVELEQFNEESVKRIKVKNEDSKKTKCEINELNIEKFHSGNHFECYGFMGAHLITEGRKRGVRFTTWAPNAKNIFVVGDFSNFEVQEKYKMNRVSEYGLYSIFIPGIKGGTKYKFAIETSYGHHIYKADPYAFRSEVRPNTASIVSEKSKHKWDDRSWIMKRRYFNMYEKPINIYEAHLGSWKMYGDKSLTYRELAEQLPKYLSDMGYTHIEILPIVEHPLDASWGYQGVGYYSATSRYGTADDFKYLINEFHKEGIGVILDWVPGHFCKDSHGLYMFDGTPTYEYAAGWKGENKGWGTNNFDLGRNEVKSFLISNALYWIKEFHIDGLRVDAVTNMLYLNYDRKYGEWEPNKYGGDGNLEAIEFIKLLNTVIDKEYPTVMTIAEESTAWPKISKPVEEGGLGFKFKWNMGWMHDTLKYVKEDPINRKYHHNKMTFSMAYHYTENFILSISHDEVVHLKGSLINKMWGDYWNKFAGLRLYMAHMITHPGKKLTFMGTEFGQFAEWQEYKSLDWHLLEQFEMHQKINKYCKELNKYYKDNASLWELDYENSGFEWISADNYADSIFSFIRKGKDEREISIVVCNYTPVVRYDYRIGVPFLEDYIESFNSDKVEFGGSGQIIDTDLVAEEKSWNGQPYSINIKVPPMAAIILKLKNK